jgi:hypothetical protein
MSIESPAATGAVAREVSAVGDEPGLWYWTAYLSSRSDGSPLTDGFKRTDIANMRWKWTVAQEEKVIWYHVIRHWRLVTFGWNGEDSPRDEHGNRPSRESLLKKLFGDEATSSYLNELD